MNILIGIGVILILITIIIFEVFLYIELSKIEQPMKNEPRTEEIPQKAELSEEQKEKQEKLRKNFENLMGFDYEKALKSSKGE